MNDDKPVCSYCNEPVEGDTKYFVFYPSPNGYRVEQGCAHHRPPLAESLAVAGSVVCFARTAARIAFGVDFAHLYEPTIH